MPLKSQAQRAWMHIHHPKMADRWEKETPKGKLPKHVGEAGLPEYFGMNEGPGGSVDVAMDIELFIRILEWAREEAQTDVQVHDLAERAEQLTAKHGEVTMEHYEELVMGMEEPEK